MARNRKYVLYPIGLICRETEDLTVPNAVYMRFGEQRYEIGAMHNGDSRPFHEDDEYEFDQTIAVELWDADTGRWGDQEDKLGVIVVDATTIPLGEEQSVNFTDEDANYTFIYEVSKNEPVE